MGKLRGGEGGVILEKNTTVVHRIRNGRNWKKVLTRKSEKRDSTLFSEQLKI